MEEQIDTRIVKTQRAIKSAFFELMHEIGFAKINVTKIIKRAEINRSTFYSHYVDKFDLLEKMEQELLMGFKAIVDKAPVELITSQHDANSEAIKAHFLHVTNYIHENGQIFTLLLSDKGDPAFTSKLSEMIKSVWLEKKLLSRLSIPPNYAFAAVIGMMSSLISEWAKSGFQETPEDFITIMVKITRDIPKNLFE